MCVVGQPSVQRPTAANSQIRKLQFVLIRRRFNPILSSTVLIDETVKEGRGEPKPSSQLATQSE
jgi:hypothetical protein